MKLSPLRLSLIFGVSLAWCGAAAAASDPFDDIAAQEIGSSIGRNLAGAINAAAGMRQAAIEASREIEGARRAYWDAVRTGRDVTAAKARFREVLDGKDLHYLIFSVPEGTEGARAVVLNLISGGIDGGIHLSAQSAFLAWIQAIRANLGAEVMWWHQTNTFVIPTPAQLAEALQAAEKQYQHYVRARDWAEIDRSGLTWPWDTDARAHALMLLNRYGNWTGQDLAQRYQDLVAMFGEDELLAAADRIRQARRNNEALLADPAAIGVSSPDPNYALLELLALKNGRTYLGYLLCHTGGSVIPSRTISEARRELERFVMAYGEEAIDEVGRVIQKLPRFSTGQIALNRVSRNDFPDVALQANAVAAFWDTLALRYPERRQRAVFIFHPGVTTVAEADRLRAELENRYGREPVADALRALLGQEPYAAVENWKRRGAFLQAFHRAALEQRGLDPQRQRDHLHDTDYAALVQLLEQGVVNVIGEPGGAWSDEDYRKDLAGRNYTEAWQRRAAVLASRIQTLRREMEEDPATYPYFHTWSFYAAPMFDGRLNDPGADWEELLRSDPALASRPHQYAQAVRTLRAHRELVGDPASAIARLAQAYEEAVEELWPRVRALERYRGEEFDLRFGGGSSDRTSNEWKALLGTWTGAFPDGAPLTLQLAMPERPGMPVGTAEYPRMKRRLSWFFLCRGYAFPGGHMEYPDGWRGFSFLQAATAAGEDRAKVLRNPAFVVLFPPNGEELDAKWYQYRSGRYREVSRATLRRAQDQSAPPTASQRPPTTSARPADRRPARPPIPRSATSASANTQRAEAAISYDGITIAFTGGAAEVAELEAAANAGEVRACLLLGELIGQRAIDGTDAEAVQWFEKGHNLGDAEWTARLALYLMTGRGVEENDPRRDGQNIWRLAQRASSQRSALGNYVMAECFAKGIGVPSAGQVARAFYIQAATQGLPLAQQWCRENNVQY